MGSQTTVSDLVVRPHHTAVCVKEFETARDFYVTVLGFRIEGEIDRRAEPGLSRVVALPDAVVRWAMLAREPYRVELFKYYTPEGRATPARQCDTGYIHMAFEVRDVDEAYRRLTDGGYATTAPPQELRGGLTKVIYLLGPEDIVTELVEFRKPAKSDGAGGQQ